MVGVNARDMPDERASPGDGFMRHEFLALPNRARLGVCCVIYAVAMFYSSTVIGPGGMNFVYRDPAGAFRFFLATPYVVHGSDQRADWIGNLLMLIPFGFLVAGMLWPRRPVLRLPAALTVILICVATILTIKYCQLFFPPRTVTLNYILAQTAGAAIGCACCAVWNVRIGATAGRGDLVAMLVLALRLYAGALFVFVLMPLDFALDATDLRAQLDRLPDTLFALPGGGRPLAVRVVLIVMAAAAFIPVGMLLAFVRKGVYQVRRGLLAVTGLGLLVTTGLFVLAALVISAYPVMPSILYRTGGVLAGAAAIRWLVRQDADALRRRLGRLVPLAVLPYLGCLLLVNRLLSTHWLSFPEAVAQAYPLGLLPLFDYYIVTKAEAAKNIVGHVALYMPVGVMLWLRYGGQSGGRAFAVASALSFGVELGRYFRPGLEGDINAVVVAGVSAMLAVRLMPAIWAMIEGLGRQSAPAVVRQWHRRGSPGGSDVPNQSMGKTEHF